MGRHLLCMTGRLPIGETLRIASPREAPLIALRGTDSLLDAALSRFVPIRKARYGGARHRKGIWEDTDFSTVGTEIGVPQCVVGSPGRFAKLPGECPACPEAKGTHAFYILRCAPPVFKGAWKKVAERKHGDAGTLYVHGSDAGNGWMPIMIEVKKWRKSSSSRQCLLYSC